MIPLPRKTVYDLVRGVALQDSGVPAGWAIVVQEPHETEALLPDLAEELQVQTGIACEVAASRDWNGLRTFLSKHPPAVVVVQGLENWSDQSIADLDLNRSSLEHPGLVILEMDRETAGRFLNLAPNLRSWIGGDVFGLQPDPSITTEEERQQRLVALSEHYGMTSSEVLKGGEDGSLPPDPEFAEWLVLLGRGDLARSPVR